MRKLFFNGIFVNNPVIVQLVGLCSVLAITTTVENALGMGAAVIFVLTCSNIVISLLRNFIPDEVRIPAYIVVIATFVTVVQMVLHAFVPALYQSLGIFIPLIVVNCIILARAESFASRNGVFMSIIDGLAQGLGYTVVVVILAIIRELFGSGSILGFNIIPQQYTVGAFTLAPGAFIVLGIMYAAFNAIMARRKEESN